MSRGNEGNNIFLMITIGRYF